MRHRDYFVAESANDAEAPKKSSGAVLALSIPLLLVSLLAVVLLSKKFSLVIDATAAMIGAPPAFAGLRGRASHPHAGRRCRGFGRPQQ